MKMKVLYAVLSVICALSLSSCVTTQESGSMAEVDSNPKPEQVSESPVKNQMALVPSEHIRVSLDGQEYYYLRGVYYAVTNEGHKIVVPKEPKILVVYLPGPDGAEQQLRFEKVLNGYMGPDLKFYKTLPKLSELKDLFLKGPEASSLPQE